MGSEIIVAAALQLVQALVEAVVEFGRTMGVPEEKLDEALKKAVAQFETSDPSELEIPE